MTGIVEHLNKEGFPVTEVIPDGKIHRFAMDGKDTKSSGWYICHENITDSGMTWWHVSFKSWAETGQPHNYSTLKNGSVSDKELEKAKNQARVAREHAEKEREEKYKIAAEEAAEYFRSLNPEGVSEYLTRKCLPNDGLRVRYDANGNFYVPVLDLDGNICSLEQIQPNGFKKAWSGAKKTGCCYWLGNHSANFFFCEGFATTVSVYLAIEQLGFKQFATICTFGSGNLGPVIKEFRDRYPGGTFIIAADNDEPGLAAANKAAEVYNCEIIYPDETGKDWNDLHCAKGIKAVSDEIKSRLDCICNRQEERDSHVQELPQEPQESKEKVGDTSQEREEKAKDGKLSEEQIEQLGKDILDRRFKLVRNEDASLLLNIKNFDKKELVVCTNEEYLLSRLRKNIIEKIGLTPTENLLNKVYGSWKLATESIAEPRTFTWNTEDEWTFKKLDFTPVEGEFDSWKEFLLRLSSPEDFMAFIWSIFETKSNSRQYLYLFDPHGQGGKSTILNVFGEIFGNAFAAINNSFIGNGASRWLMAHLYGKRLVTWPDCKNTHFCMSEMLRNITSGDQVTVEFKSKAPFTTRMYVKFIIASNHEPSITGGGADLSRLIRIDVAQNKNNTNDSNWKIRLKAELPYFLFECRKWYEEKCKTHGNIELQKTTSELGEDSTMEVESKYEAIAKRHLEFDPQYVTSIDEWMDLCAQYKLNNLEIKNFKDYLRQGHDIIVIRRNVNHKKISEYPGMKICKLARPTA